MYNSLDYVRLIMSTIQARIHGGAWGAHAPPLSGGFKVFYMLNFPGGP